MSMKKIILLILMIMIPCNSIAGDFPSKADIYWLTQNIYHEARGEDLFGQMMVGMVTLERLHSGKWGKTIKDVVTSPSQFSWYSDGKSDKVTNKESWSSSKTIALFSLMLYSKIRDHGVMYYHNDKVHPVWTKKMIKVAVIGNHTFYKEDKKC